MDDECITKLRNSNSSANSLQHWLLEAWFMDSPGVLWQLPSLSEVAFISVCVQPSAAFGLPLVAALVVLREKYLCTLLWLAMTGRLQQLSDALMLDCLKPCPLPVLWWQRSPRSSMVLEKKVRSLGISLRESQVEHSLYWWTSGHTNLKPPTNTTLWALMNTVNPHRLPLKWFSG